jgi:hypothetical protein
MRVKTAVLQMRQCAGAGFLCLAKATSTRRK